MKQKSLTFLIAGLGILLLIASFYLVACQQEIIAPKEPEIAYGRDQCDECGMIISEERFASALQLRNGKYRKFDDTGEMIKYQINHSDAEILAWWVHDYESLEWIRGEKAYFVKSPSMQTPMGTGILAFKTMDGADQFVANHNGTVYSLDEIRTQVQQSEGKP
jgi:copper chaperone NosL